MFLFQTVHANVQPGFDHGILLEESGMNGLTKITSSADSPFGSLKDKYFVAVNNISLCNMSVDQIDSILKTLSGDVILLLRDDDSDVENQTAETPEGGPIKKLLISKEELAGRSKTTFVVALIGSVVAFLIAVAFGIVIMVASHRTCAKIYDDFYSPANDFRRIRFSFPIASVFSLISVISGYAAGRLAKIIKPTYKNKTSTAMVNAWVYYGYYIILGIVTFKYHLEGYEIPQPFVYGIFGCYLLSWLSMATFVGSVWFHERFH